jgi:hypothetical protein
MSKLRIDVRDFKKEMDRVEKEMLQKASLEVSDLIDYATATLKIVTPVDTGEAREGWYNIKAPSITGDGGGYINNPVEHIKPLNNGHSQQAPKFFIEQVLLKIGLLTP